MPCKSITLYIVRPIRFAFMAYSKTIDITTFYIPDSSQFYLILKKQSWLSKVEYYGKFDYANISNV